jgi:hypothetical protein
VAFPSEMRSKSPTKQIEPMRGSAFRLVLYSGVRGALPLMAHPQRYTTVHETTKNT